MIIKKYLKWYLLAVALIFVVFFSARPWRWITSSADEQTYRTIVVKKTWNDGDNVDNIRPDNVRMQVLQNGTVWREITLTKQDNWETTITDAPETDANGREYDYTLKEIIPDGYSSTIQKITAEKPALSGILKESTGTVPESVTQGEEYDLEYKITVTGDPGAKYTVTDSGMVLTDGLWSGTIGANGKSEIFVRSHNVADGSKTEITHANTAYLLPGSNTIPVSPDDDPAKGHASNTVTTHITVVKEKQTFTVTWVDEDGSTVLDTKTFTEDENEPATEHIPIKAADAAYTYLFKEWIRTADANGNITYRATYDAIPVQVKKITITWKDGLTNKDIDKREVDVNSTIDESMYPSDPVHDGYEFTGWSSPVTGADNNITITAQFREKAPEMVTITVNFEDRNGDIVKARTLEVEKGSSYDVTDIIAELPEGYVTHNGLSGESVSGTANEDKTIVFSVRPEQAIASTITNTGFQVDSNTGNRYIDYTIAIKNVSHGDLYGLRVTNTLEVTGNTTCNFHDFKVDGQPITPTSGGASDLTHVFNLIGRNDIFANDRTVILTYRIDNIGKSEINFDNKVNMLYYYAPSSPKARMAAANTNVGAVTYSVTDVTEYDSTIRFNVTNTHIPSNTVPVIVNAVWNDRYDADGLRPASVPVDILRNGEVVKTITLKQSDNWVCIVNNMLKFDPVTKADYTYTVKEKDVPNGYTAASNGLTVTYDHMPEKTTITIKAIWNDSDNADKIRPKDMSVTVTRDNVPIKTVTLTEAEGWKLELEDYPDDIGNGGQNHVYKARAAKIPDGYTSVSDGLTIVNTHEPSRVGIEVKSIWNDNDDTDGIRPSYQLVKVLRDGKTFETITLSDDNNWTQTLNNLPEVDPKTGRVHVYTIEPINLPAGYNTSVNKFTITNTHTPASNISVTATVRWNDGDNIDGIRPKSLTVNILRNGTAFRTVTLTEADNWSTVVDNLPKFDPASGKDYVYSVANKKIPDGYTESVNRLTLTNTHVPGGRKSIIVNVEWNDTDNAEGVRPNDISIDVLRDGTKFTTVMVTADDGWTYEVTGLPETDPINGHTYEYSLAKPDMPNGYSSTVNGLTIIGDRTRMPLTDLTVSVVWDDKNDKDGIRPKNYTVRVLRDGKPFDTVVLSSDNNWTKEYQNLEAEGDNGAYKFTVEQTATPDGYMYSVKSTNNNFVMINTHTPEEVFLIAPEIVWDDGNDIDNIRPDTAKLNILQNGDLYKTVTLSEDGGWRTVLEGLPETDRKGNKYMYTADMPFVSEGYSFRVDGITIICSHTPKVRISINVQALWDDEDDKDDLRPESVAVEFYQNDKLYDTVILTAAGNWQHKFTDLPETDDNGKLYEYTVKEPNVPEGYTTTINGCQITNTHIVKVPEVIGFNVSIVWNDENNKDGSRPENIDVVVNRNNEEFDKVVLNETTKWSYAYEGLLKYDSDNKEYVYSIIVDAPEGYEIGNYDISEGNYIITCSHIPKEPERISLTVTAIWDDADNKDMIRPESLEFIICQNDTEFRRVILEADNKWTYTCDDLLKYDADGKEYQYMVKTDEIIEGYETSVDGYTITNKHTIKDPEPEKNACGCDDPNCKHKDEKDHCMGDGCCKDDDCCKDCEICKKVTESKNACGCDDPNCKHKDEKDHCKGDGCCKDTDCCKDCETCKKVTESKNACGCDDPNCKHKDEKNYCKGDGCCKDADCCKDCEICKKVTESENACGCDDPNCKYKAEKDYCKGDGCCKDADCCKDCETCKKVKNPCGCDDPNCKHKDEKDHCKGEGCCKDADCCKDCETCKKVKNPCGCDDPNCKHKDEKDHCKGDGCCKDNDCCKDCETCKKVTDSKKNVCGCDDPNCKHKDEKDHCKGDGCCKDANCCKDCKTCKKVTATKKNACGCDDPNCKHKDQKNYCKNRAGCCADSDCCKDCKTCKAANACGCEDPNCKHKSDKDHCINNPGCCADVNCCKNCKTCKPAETKKSNTTTTTKQNQTTKNQTTTKSDKTSTTTKPTAAAKPDSQAKPADVVKTGQNFYLLIGILGLVLMSGAGYFLMETEKGRKLIDQMGNFFSRK